MVGCRSSAAPARRDLVRTRAYGPPTRVLHMHLPLRTPCAVYSSAQYGSSALRDSAITFRSFNHIGHVLHSRHSGQTVTASKHKSIASGSVFCITYSLTMLGLRTIRTAKKVAGRRGLHLQAQGVSELLSKVSHPTAIADGSTAFRRLKAACRSNSSRREYTTFQSSRDLMAKY